MLFVLSMLSYSWWADTSSFTCQLMWWTKLATRQLFTACSIHIIVSYRMQKQPLIKWEEFKQKPRSIKYTANMRSISSNACSISNRRTSGTQHSHVNHLHKEWDQQVNKWITMVDSTKLLCPLFDKNEILIPSDSPSIFPYLDKMWNLIRYRKIKKNDFIELEWMHKGIMSIPLFHEGFKSSRWLDS